MTDAPDPGLTDLIAADLKSHTWGHEYENAAHEDHTFDGGCKVCRGDVDAIAARALSVVEQHTNGQAAKLAEAVQGMWQLMRKLDETANGLGDWDDATEYIEWARKEVQEIYVRAALEGEQQ